MLYILKMYSRYTYFNSKVKQIKKLNVIKTFFFTEVLALGVMMFVVKTSAILSVTVVSVNHTNCEVWGVVLFEILKQSEILFH